jgi:metallophosphoesterase (TIGR00282 family)
MRILIVGDIVGSPGRAIFREVVERLRGDGSVHAVVANAENAAAGNGITGDLADELLKAGADVLTLGDHAWNQKDIETYIAREKRLLRPANFAPACPGRGWVTVQTTQGPLTVINLVGRVFMPPVDCPFRAADTLLAAIPGGSTVLVDLHAEATSEKIAMGWHLDGRVAAVVGTHTHVQTSDEKILPNGTAYITDIGMTGPTRSVIGREVEPVLRKFIAGMPSRLDVAKGPAALEGAIVDVDRSTLRAVSILRVRENGTHR